MSNKTNLRIINIWICSIEKDTVRPCFGDVHIREGKIDAFDLRAFPKFSSVQEGINTIDGKGRAQPQRLGDPHPAAGRAARSRSP